MAVDMDYGCDESSAYTSDLADALPDHFRFHSGISMLEPFDIGWDFEEWWSALKYDFNRNRPIPYRIPGHAIVADGWDEQDLGGEIAYFLHVVYGWNGSNDGWFTPLAVPGSDWLEPFGDSDYILRHVRPEGCVMTPLDVSYPPLAYPYRYFDRDTEGANSDFEGGQQLQVLRSGFLVSNVGTQSTDTISFHGSSGQPLEFFLEGDAVGKKRIRVLDGAIKIRAGGQMAIY
jgi:hypothetical protein